MATKTKRKITRRKITGLTYDQKKREQTELRDLPYTVNDVYAYRVSSVTDAMAFIRFGHAIAAAGDDGALCVWKDDRGEWVCHFMRFMSVKSRKTFKHIAPIAEWLKEWWPKMRR